MTVPKSRKGTALKNKMCSKTSLIKKETGQKAAKISLWRTKSNAETSRNKTLDVKTWNKTFGNAIEEEEEKNDK